MLSSVLSLAGESAEVRRLDADAAHFATDARTLGIDGVQPATGLVMKSPAGPALTLLKFSCYL